jgi:hypothetical protein
MENNNDKIKRGHFEEPDITEEDDRILDITVATGYAKYKAYEEEQKAIKEASVGQSITDLVPEQHRYLKKYPIDPNSKHWIIGTIHAPKPDLDFFYGSSSSIWKIFKESFPEIEIDPNNVDSILRFLNKNGISITDTIVCCHRIKEDSALDKDLIPIQFNEELKYLIQSSKVEHLYFTSGFGKNNAFRLFYTKIIGHGWVEVYLKTQREFSITIGNKKVQCHILLSPSGSANLSIARSKEYKAVAGNYKIYEHPINKFRIDFYRKVFAFLR